MIVRYSELPGAGRNTPRPLLEVILADVSSIRVPCLVDTGAVNSLLPRWSAEIVGLDLDATEQATLAVGGTTVSAAFAVTRLEVAGLVWEAPVGFCEPWPYAWGLLGHDSFFRWFTVTFRAADFEFEVTPNDA